MSSTRTGLVRVITISGTWIVRCCAARRRSVRDGIAVGSATDSGGGGGLAIGIGLRHRLTLGGGILMGKGTGDGRATRMTGDGSVFGARGSVDVSTATAVRRCVVGQPFRAIAGRTGRTRWLIEHSLMFGKGGGILVGAPELAGGGGLAAQSPALVMPPLGFVLEVINHRVCESTICRYYVSGISIWRETWSDGRVWTEVALDFGGDDLSGDAVTGQIPLVAAGHGPRDVS